MNRAYGFAFCAVLFWSTVATAFKLVLSNVQVDVVLFYSTLSSTVILLGLVIIQGKFGNLHVQFQHHWKKSAFSGLLNPFGYYLILFKAYSLLPAQMAQPLNYTWPLVLVVLSALIFHERVSLRNYLGIMISFGGVLVIATRGDFSTWRIEEPFGVFLAIGSSTLWATFWLINYRDDCEPVSRMLFNFLFGSLYIGLLVALMKTDLRISPSEFGLCCYIGAFEMGITFIVWLRAMQISKGTLVSHMVYLSPFISLLFIHFILKEEIMPSSIAGLVLIISGILAGRRKDRDDKTQDSGQREGPVS